MSNNIHPTAIIGDKVKLGDNVAIGAYSVIEDEISIGDRTSIGNHNTIKQYSEIGKDCRIFHNCVIGELPQDAKFGGEITSVKIGDGTMIREFSSVHRGTNARGETTIGKNVFLMAYAHVAHDCIVADNAILISGVLLGGHSEIGEWATISGGTVVHQFVKIGAYAYIGGLFRVVQDVPPFVLAAGEPLRFSGINSIGLRRKGFSAAERTNIKKAYRIYYNYSSKRSEKLQEISDTIPNNKNIALIIDFIENSNRGIIRPNAQTKL